MSKTTITARIRADGKIVRVSKRGKETAFPHAPMRPMTEEQAHKVSLYAIKECKGVPTGTPEKVLCMQAVFIRVGKSWSEGRTPSFLK